MTIARVFIPNRGEIAVRIVRACRELGLESVVGASDVDLEGLAARTADRVVCIGPGPATDSYLRDDVVVQAALRTGCDAIHPGYGFLSESPRLATRAQEQGLVFVGPPPDVIELAGDKLRAREQAAGAGLPVLPDAAFGDDRVYVERFVAAARQVAVQIAADEHGNIVHLGERDCSVQRRYQKVVEEAPAPVLSSSTREALCAAALSFARTIGYSNLGSVEFIVDSDNDAFFFLEVNCRIQVEHPVTEAVTGRDLLALQLQVAGGQPLGFTQDQVVFDGHAIECRLNAEDVAHGFLPTPGTLSLFAVPELPQLRTDTHCFAGAVIPPYYDSLLAKLIARGSDRETAIDVLLDALEDVDVEGVETNRTLLISVLGHPDFRAGAVSTDWLERAIA
jgi:acetyl-CoA carboxylase biotin carboxylase subunit